MYAPCHALRLQEHCCVGQQAVHACKTMFTISVSSFSGLPVLLLHCFAVFTDAPASRQAKDISVRTLLAVAAQYICLAHALQPSKEIYRKSLGVVRQMLPLPFLRAGFLTAPRSRSIGTVTETYRRDWFVLDHRSLRQASSMETSLSTAGAGALGFACRASDFCCVLLHMCCASRSASCCASKLQTSAL
jgi:hypothetical protein